MNTKFMLSYKYKRRDIFMDFWQSTLAGGPACLLCTLVKKK
jgi:hypothetical protein